MYKDVASVGIPLVDKRQLCCVDRIGISTHQDGKIGCEKSRCQLQILIFFAVKHYMYIYIIINIGKHILVTEI